MAALTVNDITRAGTGETLTFANAAGGGDTYTWSKDTVLLVQTGATASQTVTAAASTTSKTTTLGVAAFSNSVLTTAANSVHILDTRDEFFKDSSGNVNLTYSGVTDLDVLPIKLADI